MEPTDEKQKLDLASRVNYAKVYTVEHNVKVCFIGTLTRNAQAQLGADYNAQHPLLEELEPENGYIVTRPLGRSNSSNNDGDFEAMSATADRYQRDSEMGTASSSNTFSPDAGPLLSYYNVHDGTSVGSSDNDNEYTLLQRPVINNSSDSRYGALSLLEQNEAERIPRRAATPEDNFSTFPVRDRYQLRHR